MNFRVFLVKYVYEGFEVGRGFRCVFGESIYFVVRVSRWGVWINVYFFFFFSALVELFVRFVCRVGVVELDV